MDVSSATRGRCAPSTLVCSREITRPARCTLFQSRVPGQSLGSSLNHQLTDDCTPRSQQLYCFRGLFASFSYRKLPRERGLFLPPLFPKGRGVQNPLAPFTASFGRPVGRGVCLAPPHTSP